MAINLERFEFDLTVKHYGRRPMKTYEPHPTDKEEKEELLEKLEFKSISAVEVIRKLLDYLY